MKVISVWEKYPLSSRILTWLLLPSIMIPALVFLYLTYNQLSYEEVVTIQAHSQKTEIIRNKPGTVAIHASNKLDAYYALGYVHAQDRLWQMDIAKRIASGRLSEFYGEKTLPFDIHMRTLGLKRQAEKSWLDLDLETKNVLNTYAQGVNAAISEFKLLPLQFELLGVKAERWLPQDSLVLMQLFLWEWSDGLNDEIAKIMLSQTVGVETTNIISSFNSFEHYFDFDIDFKALIGDGLNYDYNKNLLPLSISAKTAWVVSGKYTVSGLPMLSQDIGGDNLYLPKWYLASLSSPVLSVSGATIPGMPIFISGNNHHISWSMSELNIDTQDLVLEKINPFSRNQYEVNGEYLDMELFEENIIIKQDLLTEKTYAFYSRATIHGPVFSDKNKILEDFVFSLRWPGSKSIGESFSSLLKINSARNWQEFNEVLKEYAAPAADFLYMDSVGNIGAASHGLYTSALNSVKSSPLEGWNYDTNQDNYANLSTSSSKYNPEVGYLIRKNDHSLVRSSHSKVLNTDTELKLIQLIKTIEITNNKLEVLEAISMQRKVAKTYLTEEQVQLIIGSANKLKRLDIVQLLENWDRQLSFHNIQSVIYLNWLQELNQLALTDDLTKLRSYEGGESLYSNILSNSDLKFIDFIQQDNRHSLCDRNETKFIESCEDIAELALQSIIDKLSLGQETDFLLWDLKKYYSQEMLTSDIKTGSNPILSFVNFFLPMSKNTYCSPVSMFTPSVNIPGFIHKIDYRLINSWENNLNKKYDKKKVQGASSRYSALINDNCSSILEMILFPAQNNIELTVLPPALTYIR